MTGGPRRVRHDDLAPPDSVLAARPSLRGYVGKTVIAGIRPEDIEDAAFAPSANGSASTSTVALAEPMGAEVIAHFPLSVRPAADEGATAMLTARLNPRSRAETGAPLRVAVDVERLYSSIRRPKPPSGERDTRVQGAARTDYPRMSPRLAGPQLRSTSSTERLGSKSPESCS